MTRFLPGSQVSPQILRPIYIFFLKLGLSISSHSTCLIFTNQWHDLSSPSPTAFQAIVTSSTPTWTSAGDYKQGETDRPTSPSSVRVMFQQRTLHLFDARLRDALGISSWGDDIPCLVKRNSSDYRTIAYGRMDEGPRILVGHSLCRN